MRRQKKKQRQTVPAFAYAKLAPGTFYGCRRCCQGLVGLLTATFRCVCISAPTPAFSPPRYRASMTRFRGTYRRRYAEPTLRFHSYKSGRSGLTRVRDFHPIPLFSENKNACPIRFPNRVAHLPQKPTFIGFLY